MFIMPLNELIAFVQLIPRKRKTTTAIVIVLRLYLPKRVWRHTGIVRASSEALEISVYILLCGGFCLSTFADTIPIRIKGINLKATDGLKDREK